MKNPKSILITGGSSGLGEGLLMHYARPGVTLAFNGRDIERIHRVEKKLKEKDAIVYSSTVDVTNREGMKEWINQIDSISPLELVVANAGIGAPDDPSLSMHDKLEIVYAVNVHGVFNTVQPALELMLRRGRGQIAIVSSIAGFMGFPNSPAYSSSKVTVKAYGRALRARYINSGVEICVICPGIVHTRMTESFYRKFPGWLDVERAVKIMVSGMEKNRPVTAFPWYSALIVGLFVSLPESVKDRLFAYYARRRESQIKSNSEWSDY